MDTRNGQTFPRELRLRKRKEFLEVRNVGRKIQTTHFVINCRSNTGRPTRLGVTASRKTGRAVQRNRSKRLIREFFRIQYERLPACTDISVIAKKGAAELGFSEVCDELNILISDRRSGRISCPGNSL